MCGSHDHDVDRDFDAGEMEKVPTGWRWLERRFCLRSEVFCRELRRMTMRTGPWIDKDFPLMNSKDDQTTNEGVQHQVFYPRSAIDEMTCSEAKHQRRKQSPG
ncbi:MAG: hypothetical protein DME27_04385 [Verrucomicrobia bacterium]|nr:MAG: hypothetical protein DME27_04385 [Verrucomicrobiota bacterium]